MPQELDDNAKPTSAAKRSAMASRRRRCVLLAFGVFSGVLVLLQGLDNASQGAIAERLTNSFAITWHGEWWRVLTAQFLHLDWTHLIIDATGILVMAGLLSGKTHWGTTLAAFLIGGAMGQLLAVLAWRSGLTEYKSLVGSSDGLHGLVYLYIALEYRGARCGQPRIPWALAAITLLASTVYTCVTGQMPFAGMLKSPGYNHWGGILVFMAALECGLLAKPTSRRKGELAIL